MSKDTETYAYTIRDGQFLPDGSVYQEYSSSTAMNPKRTQTQTQTQKQKVKDPFAKVAKVAKKDSDDVTNRQDLEGERKRYFKSHARKNFFTPNLKISRIKPLGIMSLKKRRNNTNDNSLLNGKIQKQLKN